MAIVRVKKTKNYTVMSNDHLRNNNLSWKAKGILSYILSLPDDWKLYQKELKSHSTDGKTSTRSGFDELVTHGYITKHRERKEDGTFGEMIYTVRETPSIKTECGKPEIGLSEIGQQESTKYLSNKVLTKQNTNNIDVADEVNKYKDIFEYYLTFDNLVSHQKYRTSYRKAMQKAERDLSLSAEEMKMIIKRHSEVVELTKNSKNAVKVRTISELFGQKKYDSTILICEDYLDTGSYYKKFIKNHERIKEGSSKDKPKVREVI